MKRIPPPRLPLAAISAFWEIVPVNLSKATSLPLGGVNGQQFLQSYKNRKGLKALAVSPFGYGGTSRSSQATEEQAADSALAECKRRTGADCLLFAQGDRLVWHDSLRAALASPDMTWARALIWAN
jgi:hypothetical protein